MGSQPRYCSSLMQVNMRRSPDHAPSLSGVHGCRRIHYPRSLGAHPGMCLTPARWLARLSWNRTVSSHDRDTDVILGGIGYRF
ncbi:hypothetical protein ACU4GI_24095 [Cupriavidus basilensis]